MISRLKVRINEVFTALNMIDFGLDNLPGGELMVEGFTYIPNRFALGFSEAPRGDDIHWSMTGDNQKLCAGVVGRRPTPTGRRCVTCCGATRSPMRR
ncbi:Hydrogenase-3 component E [Leclercia adecarboxylata]|uniref:Hydrogenase-3 component E n=1 Tax=Leclercia adecarboxylata TaxID=83655 RepID=A0A4U9IIC2_9ENTR|nr:Hydrogenase-3 component E [Leclercia adecarboxylata]